LYAVRAKWLVVFEKATQEDAAMQTQAAAVCVSPVKADVIMGIIVQRFGDGTGMQTNVSKLKPGHPNQMHSNQSWPSVTKSFSGIPVDDQIW
jgi:hypothetical protein